MYESKQLCVFLLSYYISMLIAFDLKGNSLKSIQNTLLHVRLCTNAPCIRYDAVLTVTLLQHIHSTICYLTLTRSMCASESVQNTHIDCDHTRSFSCSRFSKSSHTYSTSSRRHMRLAETHIFMLEHYVRVRCTLVIGIAE